MLPSVVALSSALLLGAPGVRPIAEASRGALWIPDLALHLASVPVSSGASGLTLDDAPGRRTSGAGGPVCSGDVCQPVVAVPGFEPRYGRAHRSEAFVALLTRARLEPLATIAWTLVATGLRLDYTPVAFDGPNSGGRGWGSVFLRLRVRLDARNAPVFPPRPR